MADDQLLLPPPYLYLSTALVANMMLYVVYMLYVHHGVSGIVFHLRLSKIRVMLL